MQQTAFAVTQASETLFAMDTVMTLTAYGKNAETAIEQAKKIVLENEARWSVTKESSEVFHLNSQGSAEISAETFEIVSRALEMSELTDGAFDITVYPLVNAWGFTAGTHRVPDEAEIKELLLLVGRDKLTISGSSAYLNAGSMIDLGGIAKGYTGDMIIDAFKSCGINSALINLGGNVQTLGAKPDGSAWRIGIKSPYDEPCSGS
ncbi:MAG: FAD:protein FMN transferase [Clostridia bacterium]|nr:FAD:protein FMN transferase [Clostridia bacterium]